MKTRVKICCISSVQEAKLAIQAGAAAVGLVAQMPSGPGVISDASIKEITATIPPGVASFLLTCETEVDAIIAHHKRTGTNTIQIVDSLKKGSYQTLKQTLPAVKIVQVIHVIDEKSVEEALEISEMADALLLDSGNPNLPIKELGGTGPVHNWQLSRKIVAASKVPVYLAGGLTATNVQQAITEVQPFGLDLCSGVRTNNQLDPQKLEAFFKMLY